MTCFSVCASSHPLYFLFALAAGSVLCGSYYKFIVFLLCILFEIIDVAYLQHYVLFLQYCIELPSGLAVFSSIFLLGTSFTKNLSLSFGGFSAQGCENMYCSVSIFFFF